jgi:hypothetical protein
VTAPGKVLGFSALDEHVLLGGATLDAATETVRAVRPQAMPAPDLQRSLQRLAAAAQAADRGDLPATPLA